MPQYVVTNCSKQPPEFLSQDKSNQSTFTNVLNHSCSWKSRILQIYAILAYFVSISLLYLTSELLIWAICLIPGPAQIRIFSPILCMGLILIITSLISIIWPDFEAFYSQWIKPRADFFNAHMSVAFTVPFVMMKRGEILDFSSILKVAGTLVMTTSIGWVATFALVLAIVAAVRTVAYRKNHPRDDGSSQSHVSEPPQALDLSKEITMTASDTSSLDSESTLSVTHYGDESSPPSSSCLWDNFYAHWSIIISFLCLTFIGISVAILARDHRLLDAFTLWFAWRTSGYIQNGLKQLALGGGTHETWITVAATMANPVVLTILFMAAYLATKAQTLNVKMEDMQDLFSAGNSIHSLWSVAVVNHTPASSPGTTYFGAGDAALGALECGIVVWGFKLYECRRKLISKGGVIALACAIGAAFVNFFLPVVAAHAIGLGTAESLSFAARTTTLALARPVMQTIGGNQAVNAVLVVLNGIFGQLMYPFALKRLGIDSQSSPQSDVPLSSPMREDISLGQDTLSRSNCLPLISCISIKCQNYNTKDDGCRIIAAGITIGINGSAMGVSYLYTVGNDAASYAVLAMTCYGVTTVLLSAIGPLQQAVITIAQ